MAGRAHHMTAYKVRGLVWLLFGILEALIGLRVLLKLIAADAENSFAMFVYASTEAALAPFAGLVVSPAVGDIVLEIYALIAMVVYALLAAVLAQVAWLLFYQAGESRSLRHHH